MSLAVVILVIATGCRGHRAAERTASSSTIAAETADSARLGAVSESQAPWLGGTVIWVPADGRATLVPVPAGLEGPKVKVSVNDGPAQAEPAWRIEPALAKVGQETGNSGLARMRHWMGPPVAWSASPAADTTMSSRAGSQLLVAVPARSGVAASKISFDGQSIPLRWLPPLSGTFDFAAPSGPAQPENPWLLAALEPMRAQPWSLWRARLATPRMGPIGAATNSTATLVMRDSVIERLGTQHAAVWSVALQRLAAADRDLARRLVIRLGGAVDFGGGVVAPVWPSWPGSEVANDGLGLLRDELLAEDLTPRERAGRARGWIDNLPRGAAWVIDDAGMRDSANGAPITTVAMANLTDVPAAASIAVAENAAEAEGAPLEMLTIPPMSVSIARVSVGADGAVAQRSEPSILSVRIGSWSGRVEALSGALAARPPGVQIGPLVRDLDMGQVVGSALGTPLVRVPRADRATVGMLQRDTAGNGGGWVLYLECSVPASSDGEVTNADSVVLSFGAEGRGGLVCRISSDGQVRMLVGDAKAGPTPGSVRVARAAGRWMCWVPLTPACVERERWLRIGIVRELTAAGEVERTAWPRPLPPWHETPGSVSRVLIDLSTWGQ